MAGAPGLDATLIGVIVTQVATVTTLLINHVYKERRERQRHEWEMHKDEMSVKSRQVLTDKVNEAKTLLEENTALTVAMLHNSAEQQGTTVNSLVESAHKSLDGLLNKYTIPGEDHAERKPGSDVEGQVCTDEKNVQPSVDRKIGDVRN